MIDLDILYALCLEECGKVLEPALDMVSTIPFMITKKRSIDHVKEIMDKSNRVHARVYNFYSENSNFEPIVKRLNFFEKYTKNLIFNKPLNYRSLPRVNKLATDTTKLQIVLSNLYVSSEITRETIDGEPPEEIKRKYLHTVRQFEEAYRHIEGKKHDGVLRRIYNHIKTAKVIYGYETLLYPHDIFIQNPLSIYENGVYYEVKEVIILDGREICKQHNKMINIWNEPSTFAFRNMFIKKICEKYKIKKCEFINVIPEIEKRITEPKKINYAV